MAGRGYVNTSKSIFDDMQSAIDSVHQRLDRAIAAAKQPTMPTYPFTTANPGDLPDDPVQGQVAISSDDDTMWFYSNGAWHQAGGTSTSWATLGTDSIATGTASTRYPDWNGDGFYTNNPDIFEYDGAAPRANGKGIKIKQRGMYLAYFSDQIGGMSGDHSADYAYVEAEFIRGGNFDDFTGMGFGPSLSPGIYNGVSLTHWYPFLMSPINLRPVPPGSIGDPHIPATVTFFIQGLPASDTTHYPRMMIVSSGTGIDDPMVIP